MLSHYDDIWDLLDEIVENKQLVCSACGSLKGGLITGISAVIGGLLFGTKGLAIGGAIGGGVAALSLQDSFQPVSTVLRNMTPQQRQRLCAKVKTSFEKHGVEVVAGFAPLVMKRTDLQELVVRDVKSFLSSEMNLSVA